MQRISPVHVKKAILWTLGIMAAAIACFFTLPVFRDHPHQPPPYSVAMHEAHRVGLALRLYALDHDGRLPATLAELVPHYTSDDRLLRHTVLTTPRAELDRLPTIHVMAFKLVPESKDRVVIVHSDAAAEVIRP